ncbi:inorganic phosphate transporter [Actinomyces ruminis]|uniref:Phosphate transporter family protein n=1 Tax=Actinomyces ruminis TaxID=1937003 RepID=A0ABX4M9B0_9ACTO|nr:inorganic phosphate transporter [Actinomyces ruminis]PHP52048.1 hypothetical protein BW737_012560 [Actinomyces ruminis]
MLVTAALVLAFTAVVGRNDGAPLCALSLSNAPGHPWRPVAFLTAVTALVPLAGVLPVADTYRRLLGEGHAQELGTVLLAAIVTLAAAVVVRVPTSVTLALVGAATGARLVGGDADWRLVARVLVLAGLAPVLAGVCARAMLTVAARIRLPHARRWVEYARTGGFICACGAYALNDGQKLAVVWTTALTDSPSGSGGTPVLPCLVAAGSGLAFAAGAGLGLGPAGRAWRVGVFAPKPTRSPTCCWRRPWRSRWVRSSAPRCP